MDFAKYLLEVLAEGHAYCDDCGEETPFDKLTCVQSPVYPGDPNCTVTYTVSICPVCVATREKMSEETLKGC